MWQAPNQRVRAAANAKKRERERARKPIHVKRINAQLELISKSNSPAELANTRLILNDLSPKGIGLFSSIQVLIGQEVVLKIEDPIKIDIRAIVIWCQDHNANSHIISNQPFAFRVGLEFAPGTPEETQAIKTFCEEVFKNHVYTLKAG